MNTVQIAYYTLLGNLRNWKMFILIIFLPLVFFILCINVTININENIKPEKVKLAYIIDETPLGTQFNQYLQTKEIQANFELQKVNSIEEGQKLVRDEKAEGFVYWEKNFSSGIEQGFQPDIKIFSNDKNSQTRLMVGAFVQNVNSRFLLNKNESSSAGSGMIEQTALSPTGRVIKDADKFPLFGLMEMLCYGALLGTFSVSKHRRRNTLGRINLTPINRFALTGGQFLANFLTLCPSSGFFIVYLMYVYGGYLNGNLSFIIIAFVLYTAIIIALGMTAGYLSRKIGVSVILVVCVNILFTAAAFVGGLGIAQGFLKAILFLSPQYHTYVVLTETIFNSHSAGIQLSLYSLAVLAVIWLGVTLYLGRRKPI